MASSYTEQPGDGEDGTFDLYDLRVEVVCSPEARILCGASPGDYFTLQGEMLYLPPGQGFSIYSIVPNATRRAGAVLPLLAAKQRATARADWMTTDAEVACPDPNCASRLRIIRTGLRRFRHSETTVVPMSVTQGTS
ncbi:hypothetical protein EDB85DRAFT_528629 [Lactarius pseudohatsudake]|nr:hypothetical protein EDB85DRAFT_528629 [Lactarius pseudohatsudake]